MSLVTKEIRHAARRLARSPAFSAAAALTLALGVAATATIFTVVNRVILRPLPYSQPEQLILIDHVAPGLDLPGELGFSQGLYSYYRQRARSIEHLAIFRGDEWTLTGEGAPQRIVGINTTASLNQALRSPTALGRWFTEKEAQERAQVVLISHSLWTTRFGSDRSIIGRTVRLDGVPREVIGVTSASFAFPDAKTQLYLPERLDETRAQTVGGFNYRGIARLRAGSTVTDVKREIDQLIGGLKQAFAGDPVAQQALDAARLAAKPLALKEYVVGAVQRTLWILLGMVGLVLLIACANVANLFLVRSEERQREVAVRRALGAGRAGIIRYFMAESLMLSLAGGAAGLLLAHAGVKLLVRYGPAGLPRMNEVAVDLATVGWVALISLVTSALFGAIPMMQRAGALSSTLREGGRGSTANRARFRARNTLMAGQVGLAVILLVASGLMLRSFMQLRAVNPGFAAEQVLTFDVALTGSEFPARADAVRFHEQLLEKLAALPGVQSVGAVSCLPLTGNCSSDPLVVRGRPTPAGTLPPLLQIRRAMPGYFETMRIPILEGRVHAASDHQQKTGALVLSRRAAELYFPGESAIGKQLTFIFDDESKDSWYTVVGIVGDTPVESLDEETYGTAYFPVIDPEQAIGQGVHGFAFALRTAVPPMTLTRAVQSATAQVSPNVAIGHVRSVEMLVSHATSRMAFTMVLLLIAGVIALLLGGIGIYGVISYVVGQRTSEIGVRMALGARPRDVSAMVLRQSGSVVGVGIVVGLAGALALSRLLKSLLFQVATTDVITYVAVTVFLLAMAGVASWLPARRAAALDPLIALRKD